MRIIVPRALKAPSSLRLSRHRLQLPTSSLILRTRPSLLPTESALDNSQSGNIMVRPVTGRAQYLTAAHVDARQGQAEQPVRDHIPREMDDDADTDEGLDEDDEDDEDEDDEDEDDSDDDDDDDEGEVYINPDEIGEDPSEISPEDYGGYEVDPEGGEDTSEEAPELDDNEDEGVKVHINPKEPGENPP